MFHCTIVQVTPLARRDQRNHAYKKHPEKAHKVKPEYRTKKKKN